MNRAMVVLLAVALGGPALGCASATRSVAKQAAGAAPKTAVPSVVDETLKAVEDPRTQERIGKVVDSPAVRKAMQSAGAAFTRGAIAGISDKTVGGLTDGAMRTAMRSAADEIPVSLAPAMRHAIATELRSPELRDALADTVAAVAREDLERVRGPLMLALGVVLAVLAATVVVLAVALRKARRPIGGATRAAA